MSGPKDKIRGGARPGAGRKKREQPSAIEGRSAAGQNMAGRVLSFPENADRKKMSPDEGAWHELIWERDRDGKLTGKAADNRRYLTDKRDGKAVHTVNHLHDKPIEHNHHFDLAETVAKVRKRLA